MHSTPAKVIIPLESILPEYSDPHQTSRKLTWQINLSHQWVNQHRHHFKHRTSFNTIWHLDLNASLPIWHSYHCHFYQRKKNHQQTFIELYLSVIHIKRTALINPYQRTKNNTALILFIHQLKKGFTLTLLKIFLTVSSFLIEWL